MTTDGRIQKTLACHDKGRHITKCRDGKVRNEKNKKEHNINNPKTCHLCLD